MLDYIGRILKVKTTKGIPNSKQSPNWANFIAQTENGAWHWLAKESEAISNSDTYYPDSGETEFSGYMSEPINWENSLHRT